MKFMFTLTLFFVAGSLLSQPTIRILASDKKASIRGLSVVSDNVIWASGTSGAVARSADGGVTWNWMTVPGYEKRDFRDIEAFDRNTALIMAVAEPAVILKTTDGGKSWRKVFEDTTKGMFLDAMDFADSKNGMVIGDPLNGKAFFASTTDGGEHWSAANWKNIEHTMFDGEAFFAASGTNIKLLNRGGQIYTMYVSGGRKSRLFELKGKSDSLPIIQGSESTGANSLDIYNEESGIIVGGDFAHDTISKNNCVMVTFTRGNVSYTRPATPPHGYRSCVIYLTKDKLVTCGTSGVDISPDNGNTWRLISRESFHVCQKAKNGKAVFLAGNSGRIGRLDNF